MRKPEKTRRRVSFSFDRLHIGMGKGGRKKKGKDEERKGKEGTQFPGQTRCCLLPIGGGGPMILFGNLFFLDLF